MKHSLKTGLSFGLTSGIITTLGVIVGLEAGTHSKYIVLVGILTIAVADSFSDALGIHIAEESEGSHTAKEIWEATFSAFVSKLATALTFILPILVFHSKTAIIISVIWGFLLLGVLSYFIGKGPKIKRWKAVSEHWFIAIIVIIITHFIGVWINSKFAGYL
ncbi:MAG: hypothetical protein FVQ77_02055 [Cytophagales bacterium]|nr:hypothetical protein [Cytophagales bacterium]